jgi:ribosome-interacting GTPase 1
MPANLTPEYLKAEKAFRAARTVDERIEWLEVMLKVVPKHKGTEHLRGDLRLRLSKLKTQQEQQRQRKGGPRGPRIDRAGAGQFLLVGMPNVGKSMLFSVLTGQDAKVAEFPYTTQMPQPGLAHYEDVGIQLVDGPPVTAEHIESWHLDMIRAADAALLLVDASSDDILEEFDGPRRKLRGSRVYLVPEEPEEPEDPIGRYVRTLLLATKCEGPGAAERVAMLEELADLGGLEPLRVSAVDESTLSGLPKRLFEFLRIVRVYTRAPGKKERDSGPPFTMPVGSTVAELAEEIHREILDNIKFVRIWGEDVYDGQAVGLDHVLHDGDTVEIHLEGR